ncbi:ethanolamine utilization protein EutS [Escherichia coli]|nr:ethanolamine utilization protein EutS [Escherichia coli]
MDKERIIQEFVPGKQVTLAHLIAHPGEETGEENRRSGCGRNRHYDANSRRNGDDRR